MKAEQEKREERTAIKVRITMVKHMQLTLILHTLIN